MESIAVQTPPEAGAAALQGRGLRPGLALFLLLVLAVGIYIGNAAYPGLLDDADASHAVVSREMLQRGEWVILYMNGIRYLMKAPLHYWLVAASFRWLGVNAFATRLPVALAVVGLTLMVYVFARRFFGLRAGFYSGLVATSSAGIFLFTRITIPEAIYAFEFTVIFYLFLRGWTGTLPPRLACGGVAICTALAMLTRGLIGVVFPLLILGLFITVTGGWRRWRELHLVSSTVLFLLVAAPWHILASVRAQTFFWSYFINEHFKRAVGTRFPPDYEAVPLWLWLGAHLVWFFPWSVFLAGVIREFPRPRTWKELLPAAQARLLLFLWASFILFFFSLTFGSRMEYYSFGAWPAMAMLLGIGLADAEESGRRWIGRMQGALAILGAALAGVLGYLLWRSASVTQKGDISSLLQEHENNFYRVSMAHLLDLTPQAFAALRLPAALAAVVLLFGFLAAWWLRRRKHPLAATVCTAFTMAGFFFAANLALGLFAPYLSTRALLKTVQPYLGPADPIVLYGEFDAGSSISFYTGRQLLLWNGRYNNLAPGSYYPDAPHIFLTDEEFLPLWRGAQRVFLFVPSEHREAARKRLPGDATYLVEEGGGKAVYVNHPLKPGQPTIAASKAPGD